MPQDPDLRNEVRYEPSSFSRGDIVMVKSYPDVVLRRAVWARYKGALFLCLEESYQTAIDGGTEPVTVPFPIEDVLVHLTPYEVGR